MGRNFVKGIFHHFANYFSGKTARYCDAYIRSRYIWGRGGSKGKIGGLSWGEERMGRASTRKMKTMPDREKTMP